MAETRRRVLFILPSLIHGGAQRVISTLLRHIDRSRFEVHLALLEAKGEYLADVPADIVLHDLKVTRVRYAMPALVRVVRKIRPDAVLSTLVFMNLSLLMVKPFLPKQTRLIVRESTRLSMFFANETRHPGFWRTLVRHLYPKADKVVCLSASMGRELADEFSVPQQKLVEINNPIDFGQIAALGASSENQFRGPGPFVVTAGRLSREKGFDVLLAAAPEVIAAFPTLKLIILGDGPLESDLQNQARSLGLESSLEFLGFQPDPWPYLRHATVVALPSRYEGLPNTMLEALALGTPVVATHSGGVSELGLSKEVLLLVPPEDPKALAGAIIAMCRNAERSSARADMSRFDVKKVAAEYSGLFEE